ncbi:MAG: dTDP-4-dehydrorhamnose 3,5-epimerase [Planctomycetaceae bacterium]|nr:dTDP-4-dehydrorhamnose 3,5-epimerase [Planctomycetaceae bacterium]
MRIVECALPDVLVFEQSVHSDERGKFQELHRDEFFQSIGLTVRFVQSNYSRSRRGVLRGLHYQLSRPQGKMVHVISGAIFDVAVDLRRSSPSFGRHLSVLLTADEPRSIYVPPGFAHGMLILSEWADVIYQCTDYYCQQDERTIIWNDPEIAIMWPINLLPTLSPKDQSAGSLSMAELYE